MRIRWMTGSTLLSLGLAGLIVVGSSGCGGETGPETGDAVVVPPPAAASPDTAAPAPTPAAGTETPAPEPAAPAPAGE